MFCTCEVLLCCYVEIISFLFNSLLWSSCSLWTSTWRLVLFWFFLFFILFFPIFLNFLASLFIHFYFFWIFFCYFCFQFLIFLFSFSCFCQQYFYSSSLSLFYCYSIFIFIFIHNFLCTDKNVQKKLNATQELESEKASMLSRGLNPYGEFRRRELEQEVNYYCYSLSLYIIYGCFVLRFDMLYDFLVL